MKLKKKEIAPSENSKNDFWSGLSERVKADIENSQKQATEGKLTSHDKIMEKYSKYL